MLNKRQYEKLVAINVNGANGSFQPTGSKLFKELQRMELVEVNDGNTDDAGNVATRLTPAGLDAMTEYEAANDPNSGNVEQTETKETGDNMDAHFEIETGEDLSIKRTSNAESKYPFDKLEVGQSFFVPNVVGDDGKEKDGITGSTVSSASKRFSQRIGAKEHTVKGEVKVVDALQYDRYFVSRRATKDGVTGRRVGRVDPTDVNAREVAAMNALSAKQAVAQ